MSNLLSALMNPQSKVLKDFLFQLMPKQWHEHEEILERLASQLVTNGDVQAVGKLFSAIYQAGYVKAVEQNMEELSKKGFNPQIVTQNIIEDTTEKKGIFNR